MQNSKIEWTDNTFNPWWGCVNISPACDNCYAQRFAARRTRTEEELWGRSALRLISNEDYWFQPHVWNKRAARLGCRERVFCGSMCDVMERRSDLNQPRQRLYRLIEDTPHLDWLLLTKRPHEYSKLLPMAWLRDPLPNVWLLTTVEHQDYSWRIDELLKVPAIVRGLSLEPLLGAVPLPNAFTDLGRAGWVIAGGESGPRPRPLRIDWIRTVRDACVAASVPFFFKQWGEYNGALVRLGKKAAGRILDGREWNEFPCGSPLSAGSFSETERTYR